MKFFSLSIEILCCELRVNKNISFLWEKIEKKDYNTNEKNRERPWWDCIGEFWQILSINKYYKTSLMNVRCRALSPLHIHKVFKIYFRTHQQTNILWSLKRTTLTSTTLPIGHKKQIMKRKSCKFSFPSWRHLCWWENTFHVF